MVERDHHFSVERLRHTQDIGAGHFVGDAARVLAIRAEGDVNLMLVAVFRVVVGVVGIAAVVEIAARCFKQIVDCALVHAVRQHAGGFLIRREGDQRRAIERVERVDLNVFDLHHITGLHDDTARFRYAPADPQVDTGFRPNKGHIGRAVLHHGGGDVDVNMIVMIMGRQYGVNLANGERIEHERGGAQVRLQFLHPRHPLHLMAGFHQRIAVALFAGAAPEIDADVSPTLGF